MQKIKLMDLIIDPSIQVRDVEAQTVSKYAGAMREGAEFPAIIVDSQNRIVAGNHRYYAYKTVFEPEYEIDCIVQDFKSDTELILFAAGDNARHGKPMNTFDMKRVIIRLKNGGITPDDIASALSIPIKKIEEWAGMQVIVVGKNKKKSYEPVKHNLEHLAGKTVTQEVYTKHIKHDLGTPIKNLAAIITRHINDNLIDTEDVKTMQNLRELSEALKGFLD